jgi:hypothetical protein
MALGGLGMLTLVALVRDMLLRIHLAELPRPAPQGPATRHPGRRPPIASPSSHTPGRNLTWVWCILVATCLVSAIVLISGMRAGWRLL